LSSARAGARTGARSQQAQTGDSDSGFQRLLELHFPSLFAEIGRSSAKLIVIADDIPRLR
jgi:hypothetical protein